MASKNQVTLTFAGDSEKLEKAFDDVGAGAKTMADKVDRASDDMSSGFDRAGSGFDTLDDKAGRAEAGFRGTMDVMSGMGELAKGNVLQGMTDLGGGVSSLAQGLGGILVPMLQRTIGFLAQTRVGMLAQAAAAKVVGAATKVWTGIQAAFNFVMALNPVFLIIAAIVILIAIIVLIATKTDFFSKLWHRIWSVIGDPVKAVWKWISETLWPGIQMVWDSILAGVQILWEGIKKYFGFWKGMLSNVIGWVTGVWDSARRIFNRLVDFVKGLPGRIGRAARGMFNGIGDAFRGAINWVIDRWNGLSFRLPSVTIPFIGTIGGATLNTPNIPRLHQGGVFPGAPGTEGLALLQAGERVTPAGRAAGGTTIVVERGDGSSVDQAVASLLLELIRTGTLRLAVRNGQVAAA